MEEENKPINGGSAQVEETPVEATPEATPEEAPEEAPEQAPEKEKAE